MTNFDDREKGFERKFINDQEIEFRVYSKRNKLLANWISKILEFSEQQQKKYKIKI